MRIRWTPLAVGDLKTISGHVERERNLVTANRVCRAILRRYSNPSPLSRPEPLKSFASGMGLKSGGIERPDKLTNTAESEQRDQAA